MTDYQLALISNSVFDVGPRIRTVILMFGLFGMSMKELMESAGEDELPVSLVLTGLSRKVRILADQMVRSGRAMWMPPWYKVR